MNYDISIIDNVEAEEYIEVVHCVFKYNKINPHIHSKITQYYAVSEEACESFKEITGLKCEVLHNLLNIEKPKKILKLVSATRIASDKGNISKRMQKLVNELELNDIPYIWLIFTNGERIVKGKGIVYLEPRLDIRNIIADADYLIQLSDTEAFCYSVLESLYLNTPVIVTSIPCFINEMGVKNGKNGYILDFDMKEIPIYDIYNNIPKFEYQPLKNEWEDKIIKVKSNYKEEKEMKVQVKALINFTDVEEKKQRKIGDIWECSVERANYLVENNGAEIIKTEIKKEPIKVEIKDFNDKKVKEINKPRNLKTKDKLTKKK